MGEVGCSKNLDEGECDQCVSIKMTVEQDGLGNTCHADISLCVMGKSLDCILNAIGNYSEFQQGSNVFQFIFLKTVLLRYD